MVVALKCTFSQQYDEIKFGTKGTKLNHSLTELWVLADEEPDNTHLSVGGMDS